jgi:hypothetical protein
VRGTKSPKQRVRFVTAARTAISTLDRDLGKMA